MTERPISWRRKKERSGIGPGTSQCSALYGGNGSLKKTTDADGLVTNYYYNGLDMVTAINYNGGKQAAYQYNATGDLVEIND